MTKFSFTRLTLLFIFISLTSFAFGQNTVSGVVTDSETGETSIGASVLIKGTVRGTVTDVDGSYSITSNVAVPYILQISMIGMETQTIEVTETNATVNVALNTQAIVGNEVVISASRVEEKILESPVTIEKLDLIGIQQSSSADYYDEISSLKGVRSASGSMTFTSYNTRGFAAVSNTRFVQLMDGMDNAAPLLNFPTGNVVGISELDIANVELVPGAASALYGPNAFNGILLMNSKSPFDYQGLSAQMKAGLTQSETSHDSYSDPMGQVTIRWAQKINDKFAYKFNFATLQAKDWVADDYESDRPSEGNPAMAGATNFDGLNLYGDETQIFLPFQSPGLNGALSNALAYKFSNNGADQAKYAYFKDVLFPGLIAAADPIQITRSGLKETDLLESRDATSIKASTALHYRINDKLEASYSYRYGNGSTVYQGSERYVLRNFIQQYHKVELKGANFFLRGYTSGTDAGKSYNLTALGALTNERLSPSGTKWVPTYAGTYIGGALKAMLIDSIIPDLASMPDAMKAALHKAARDAANADVAKPGSTEFQNAVNSVRNGLFQKGGAGFIDDSKLYHVEGNVNLSSLVNDVIGLQVGGNWRQYDLFSDGTIFNEDPNGTGTNSRIKINEYGAYTQIQKKVMDDRLKLGASLRFDKNDNFDGNITPRLSLVYSAGDKRQHNFRASFQTGFRNPSTQALYIYFPTTNIIIGTSKKNAERYGLHNGRVWTKASYDKSIGALLQGDPNYADLRKTISLDYVKPENLKAFEVGYKGVLANKLMADFNVYYNIYNDFINQQNVVNIDTVRHQKQAIAPGQSFRVYYNEDREITSYGVGLGIAYSLAKSYKLTGNVSYQEFSYDGKGADNDNFESGFNMPGIMFNVGIANRKIAKNLGFGISYRWSDEFRWENSFGNGTVKAQGTLNGQLSYKIKPWKTIAKLGASNILGTAYRTNVGGPWVGRTIFLSLTYDQMSR